MAKNKSRLFFSHDSNARNSEKLLRVRMHLKAEGYAAYFMILERLREEKDFMSVKDYNAIAFDLRVDASVVKRVVEDFGLFVFTEDGEYFYSESLRDRMESECDDCCVDSIASSQARAKSGKAGSVARWGAVSDASSKPAWVIREERLAKARELGSHSKEDWDAMKSFFGECVRCGAKGKLIRGHIVPISSGGCDTIMNIQPVCVSCSRSYTSEYVDYRRIWADSHGVSIPEKWLSGSIGCSESCKSRIANCIATRIANYTSPYSKSDFRIANCIANGEKVCSEDKESSVSRIANCIANDDWQKKESLTKKENISSNEEIEKENLIKEKSQQAIPDVKESDMFHISSMLRTYLNNDTDAIIGEKRKRMTSILSRVAQKPEIMMPEQEQEKFIDWYCEPVFDGSEKVRAENLISFTIYGSAKRWMTKLREKTPSHNSNEDNKTDKTKGSRYERYKSALERLNRNYNGEQANTDRPDEQ